ncbi:MAG TPA: TrkH family potassium uptake protein [Planctomycetaceae bacterium]|nr:TrkH family potassium uptake protein [Planctomycetaceae bacterium]
MDFLNLARYLGIVCLIIGASMLLSIPWAHPALGAAVHFEWAAVVALASSAAVAAAVGAGLCHAGRRASGRLLRKETMAVVGLSWILATLFGALPYLFSGTRRSAAEPMSLADAIFESASGFTGTGATVLTDVEDPKLVPRAILFWRSETHFLGGLGIMVLFVAILGLGSAGKALMRTEMPGPSKETGVTRTQHAAWTFSAIYLGLNALLASLLMAQGMNAFDALCHAFGTVATGGFSTCNDSVGHFHDLGIEMTIAVFMVVACTNFALLYMLLRWKPLAMLADVEFRTYLGVLAAATGLVVVFGMRHADFSSWAEAFRYGFFQVASILTNTGFTTHDFDNWNEIGRGTLFLLMFVGGCAGSTSCSLKVIRHILFVKILWRELERVYRPSVVRPLRVGGKPVEERDIVHSVLVYFGLILMIAVLAWFALNVLEPDSAWSDLGSSRHEKLVDIASGVGATINGVGPGLGTIGAVENYAHFQPASKLVFVLLMLLGRLELFVILVLFTPRFWRSR